MMNPTKVHPAVHPAEEAAGIQQPRDDRNGAIERRSKKLVVC